MNMFKPSKAKTTKEYMQALPPERRKEIEFLDALIKKTAPKLKAHFARNMLGYGTFTYKSKNKTLEWHILGLASQKNYISLFVCAVEKGQYIAEIHKKELGNVTIGKSCISFKKLSDVNLATLKKVIKAAEKSPGLTDLYASARATTALKDGARCKVIMGVHAGKSGVVRDIKKSKTGEVTITVVQSNGVKFKTLARNVKITSI